LARHFFNKLLILRETLLGAKFLMSRTGEVRLRIGAVPDFILFSGMEGPS